MQPIEDFFFVLTSTQPKTTKNGDLVTKNQPFSILPKWMLHNGLNLEIDLEEPKVINYVLIQEYIRLGQRIKNFSVEVEKDGNWKEVAQGTTIGYKRILKIEQTEAQKVQIVIKDSKACPVISNVEVY